MTHRIYKRKKRNITKTQKQGNNIIDTYCYLDQEIQIKKDHYGRCTNVSVTSYFPYGHFPKYCCIQKIRLVYDDKGYLSDFQYTFISGQNKSSQNRHYTYDESHLPTTMNVTYIENDEIVYTETIKFHATYSLDGNLISITKQHNGKNIGMVVFTKIQNMQFFQSVLENMLDNCKTLCVFQKDDVYEVYLPTGELSCSITKIQTHEGMTLYKIQNPIFGKYLWRLSSRTLYQCDLDGTICEIAYFEFEIYEHIFTVDIFSEICHYAKATTDKKIDIGIYGLLFATPQQEAKKIAEIAAIQNITYQFLL